MIRRGLEFRAGRNISIGPRLIECYIVKYERDEAFLAQPLTFEPAPEGFAPFPQPTMYLRDEEAQGVMDELWRCGMRPTEGSGSAGSLAATERHLADMQKIAWGVLKKQGVKL